MITSVPKSQTIKINGGIGQNIFFTIFHRKNTRTGFWCLSLTFVSQEIDSYDITNSSRQQSLFPSIENVLLLYVWQTSDQEQACTSANL